MLRVWGSGRSTNSCLVIYAVMVWLGFGLGRWFLTVHAGDSQNSHENNNDDKPQDTESTSKLTRASGFGAYMPAVRHVKPPRSTSHRKDGSYIVYGLGTIVVNNTYMVCRSCREIKKKGCVLSNVLLRQSVEIYILHDRVVRNVGGEAGRQG